MQRLVEELFDSGATPEEACRSCPELLREVRARWRQVCSVQAELDAMFPTVIVGGSPTSFSAKETALPRIDGYVVESVLGRGGMGIVFRARHLRLNRVVALKMALADAYAAGPLEGQRFQREAEAVAQLQHPHVVQIYDVGDSEGQPYFTMEYVDGGTLAQHLAECPLSTPQAAALLLETLARAVEVAHRNGIVHRDLKPANVLLTIDGVPKISDFGLARRVDSDASLTPAGSALGTPSYMAPEQARGNATEIGPAADIHALGAILYETLTGRPPFGAESAPETLQQVVSLEPVPPSHLNAVVPRDLETICLKCLQKQPQRRYSSAAALAEDLSRFQQGRPILARRVSRSERLLRWIRRNPTSASLIFAVFALLGLSIGAGMREWAAADERRHEIGKSAARLDYVIRLQQEGRFPEARLVLGRVSDVGSEELHGKIKQAHADLKLAERLDAIRLRRATRLGHKLALVRSEEDYEAAFRDAGLGGLDDAPDAVAVRIRASNIRTTLIAAFDDWSVCVVDARRLDWVLAATRQADAEPTEWRNRARDPKVWNNRESLAQEIAKAPVATESVPLLLALAERTKAAGVDSIPFLRRVQRAHPDDFWANLSLAEALMEKNELAETLRFYQAALALRPETSVVYDNIGMALALLGRMDDADEQFRHASRIDPAATLAHESLGIAFSTVGRRNEEIDPQKMPQYFRPDVARLHCMIGDHLRDKGKLVEAADRYRQAVALDPKLASAQSGLRTVLMRMGQLDDAQRAWGKEIATDPKDHGVWDGYAEFCLFLGQEAEYRRVRRAMLDRFGTSTEFQIAERTGRACLLLPGSVEELSAAERLVDRALLDKNHGAASSLPYYWFAKGLAEYRRGRLVEAIATMDGKAATVMGPSPRLILAMAQHRTGRFAEARKTFAAAVRSFDWRLSRVDYRDDWIHHVLRREAEALVLPKLQAFLSGNRKPRDNGERLALLEDCRCANRSRSLAQLYVDVFEADPKLANDLRSGHRYGAARAAVLAGSDRCDEGAPLGEVDRMRWRDQARRWLRADLAAWAKTLPSDSDKVREAVRQTLLDWKHEPELADVREPAALAKLSANERTECLAFWNEVDAVCERSHGHR